MARLGSLTMSRGAPMIGSQGLASAVGRGKSGSLGAAYG
jgi:hypothetical protein